MRIGEDGEARLRVGRGSVLVRWASVSDVGRSREVNEDSVVVAGPVFSVADGMGGHSAGDIASAAVVERLDALGTDAQARDAALGPQDVELALSGAVADIDERAGNSELGTGTTATGVVLTATADGVPSWLVFNIGDSRVYELRDEALRQVTVDHSVVQELLSAGRITAEEAEVHPHANVITRAVGFNDAPSPDYVLLDVVPGQRLIACSDGLTKELTDVGIGHFTAAAHDPAAAVADLLRRALENSGRDNVTVLVVEVLELDSGATTDTTDSAPRGVGGLADAPAELPDAGDASASDVDEDTNPSTR